MTNLDKAIKLYQNKSNITENESKRKYTLINENVIYNENKNIHFEGTMQEVKNYLNENGLIFIRQSQFSKAIYFKKAK